TAATSRRSNSRLPTTLNARDQPPAEVSDQRVSGLTGAVHPERGRKLGEPISDHRTLSVVRPKTPRGDGNLQHHHHPAPQLSMSSDPKPREGTETLRRRIRDLFPRIGRQTQNPERGRKLPRRLAITTPTNGRQTQNPERGRKLDTDMTAVPHLTQSSDPKPREGTETRMVGKLALGSESSRQTQNPERGRKPASGKSVRSKRFQRVVRPKTPRGDGNSKSSTTSAAAACSRSRQTQNPERGRKLNNTFFERGAVESVVRPKTPRGDGNPRRKGHRS
ncbi:hypothetical protein AN70_02918, partial [Mycobacterium tuberculosis M1272]